MKALWLWLLGILTAFGVVWYVARRRALAAPELVEDPSRIMRASAPLPGVAPMGPIQRWRVNVLRAAEQYRDAVAAAHQAVPRWGGWVEAQRIANLLADAATTEDRAKMRFRLAFVRNPLPHTYFAVQDAGPQAVELVRMVAVRLEELRAAADAIPGADELRELERASLTPSQPVLEPSPVELLP